MATLNYWDASKNDWVPIDLGGPAPDLSGLATKEELTQVSDQLASQTQANNDLISNLSDDLTNAKQEIADFRQQMTDEITRLEGLISSSASTVYVADTKPSTGKEGDLWLAPNTNP